MEKNRETVKCILCFLLHKLYQTVASTFNEKNLYIFYTLTLFYRLKKRLWQPWFLATLACTTIQLCILAVVVRSKSPERIFGSSEIIVYVVCNVYWCFVCILCVCVVIMIKIYDCCMGFRHFLLLSVKVKKQAAHIQMMCVVVEGSKHCNHPQSLHFRFITLCSSSRHEMR